MGHRVRKARPNSKLDGLIKQILDAKKKELGDRLYALICMLFQTPHMLRTEACVAASSIELADNARGASLNGSLSARHLRFNTMPS